LAGGTERFPLAADAIGQCGGLDAAISIDPQPSLQPLFPFEIGISYASSGTGGSLSTLGMVRWDPVGKVCVPLETRVDSATEMVYATINHLSDFSLMQITPKANMDQAIIFPNPLFTHRHNYFTFSNYPALARMRVYTLHGEMVFEGYTNAQGLATWRPENMVGRPLASGVYIAVIEAAGTRKKEKIVVIR